MYFMLPKNFKLFGFYAFIMYIGNAEQAKCLSDADELSGQQGLELSRTPVDLKNGDWILKVVPWIGGRIISMKHIPSGII